MRLVHVRKDGSERPAVMLESTIYDASGWCRAWTGEEFARNRLTQLREKVREFPVVTHYDGFGPCVKEPSQLLAVGLNYKKHVAESKMTLPSEPVCFTKSIHSISGPNDDVVMPLGASKLDWEIELAIVLGEYAYQLTVEEASRVVGGYFLANDISERHWQLEREGQWLKGKSAPTFCPIGPWVVPADEIDDPSAIELSLSVNGRARQHDTTSSMIFSVSDIVSSLSQYFPLYPGDVILTGTPEGVGMATDEYLQPGDVIQANGTLLGQQGYRVVAQKE